MSIIKTLDDISLKDITPENLYSDSNIKAIVKALDPELKLITQAANDTLILPRINELPESLLDILAWQLHVDFYDLAKTLKMKRELVANSLIWHKKKGTSWAIRKALEMLGIKAEIIPWYQNNGVPYSFKVVGTLEDDYYRIAGTDNITGNIRRAVEEAKSARSFISDIDITLTFFEPLHLPYAFPEGQTGSERIMIARPLPDMDANFYAGVAVGLQGTFYIAIQADDTPDKDASFYTGTIIHEQRDIYFGVEESVIQELLLQFEQRIFARIDAMEARVTQTMNDTRNEVNAKIDEVRKLLTWADADEPLS